MLGQFILQLISLGDTSILACRKQYHEQAEIFLQDEYVDSDECITLWDNDGKTVPTLP